MRRCAPSKWRRGAGPGRAGRAGTTRDRLAPGWRIRLPRKASPAVPAAAWSRLRCTSSTPPPPPSKTGTATPNPAPRSWAPRAPPVWRGPPGSRPIPGPRWRRSPPGWSCRNGAIGRIHGFHARYPICLVTAKVRSSSTQGMPSSRAPASRNRMRRQFECASRSTSAQSHLRRRWRYTAVPSPAGGQSGSVSGAVPHRSWKARRDSGENHCATCAKAQSHRPSRMSFRRLPAKRAKSRPRPEEAAPIRRRVRPADPAGAVLHHQRQNVR